ncbi:MAG: NAD(P)-dependent oxidoreductase [Pseudomonadota bacterium]
MSSIKRQEPLGIAVASDYAAQLRDALVPLLPDSIDVIEAGAATPDAALSEVEVLFGAPDRIVALLPRLPALRWVQSTWAGITPLVAQPRRDFQLTGVKGIFGAYMAEYVLGWSLALRRSILHYAASTHWDFRRDDGLAGLRLGIAGTGSIGAEVARRCAPFFSEVVGLNSDGRRVEGFARCYGTGERLAFGAGLDVLALVLPDTPGTDGLVDAALLDGLASGAILINGGRANALVLDDALSALEGNRLSAMVLDVFDEEPLARESPLWRLPGLYITSHSAAPTSLDAVTKLFLANLQRYCSGSELEGVIDLERGY